MRHAKQISARSGNLENLLNFMADYGFNDIGPWNDASPDPLEARRPMTGELTHDVQSSRIPQPRAAVREPRTAPVVNDRLVEEPAAEPPKKMDSQPRNEAPLYDKLMMAQKLLNKRLQKVESKPSRPQQHLPPPSDPPTAEATPTEGGPVWSTDNELDRLQSQLNQLNSTRAESVEHLLTKFDNITPTMATPAADPVDDDKHPLSRSATADDGRTTDHLRRQQTTLAHLVAERDSAIEAQAGTIADLEEEVAKLNDRLTAEIDINRGLRAQIEDDAERASSAAEGDMEMLRAAVLKAEERTAAAEEKVAELEEKTDAETEQAKGRVQELEARLADAGRLIEESAAENAKLLATSEQYQTHVTEKEAQLVASLQDAEHRGAAKAALVRELEQRVEALTVGRGAEVDRLEAALAQSQARLQQAVDGGARLQASLTEAEARLALVDGDTARLAAELADERAAAGRRLEQEERMQARLIELRGELQLAREAGGRASDITAENTALRTRCSETEDRIRQLGDQTAALEEQRRALAEMQRRVTSAEDRAAAAEARATTAESRREADRADLVEELRTLKEVKNALQTELLRRKGQRDAVSLDGDAAPTPLSPQDRGHIARALARNLRQLEDVQNFFQH